MRADRYFKILAKFSSASNGDNSAVGRVVETRQNKTHQVVKLHVTCVYKAPKEKRETMLHQV